MWDLSRAGTEPVSPVLVGGFLTTGPPGKSYFCLIISYSVQFSCLVVSDSLRPHEPQQARPPCPSPTPGVYSNSCPLSRWCHPTISSSIIPFSCLQSFPASGSFQVSQFFPSGGQSIGVSAFSISLSNEYSRLISFRMVWLDLLAVQRLSRVFSNTTVQKHQFFGAQLSL